jgi:predicted tellurium resistance membrane protein TerC
MEIILGIDNLIFISLLTSKLPEKMRANARIMGLTLALVVRTALLFSISYIIGMKDPLFTVKQISEFFGLSSNIEFGLSWRDLIMFSGGSYLIYQTAKEIHHSVHPKDESDTKIYTSFWLIILQIVCVDFVFSFDSVLTAVGLVDSLPIMIIAVILSMGLMMVFSQVVSDFLEKEPTLKLLALAFLFLIGTILTAEGFHIHVPKLIIYTAIGFGLSFERLIAYQEKAKQLRIKKGNL